MFESMTVNELKIAAKVFRIDLGKTTKKADIISIFESAGFSYEDYKTQTEEQFQYKEAEPVVTESIVVKDETKSEEKVVIRMTYPRGALNVSNRARFTIEEPYKVVSKKEAEEIIKLAQGEVMMATPEEVASFYGIKK